MMMMMMMKMMMKMMMMMMISIIPSKLINITYLFIAIIVKFLSSIHAW
jgi:hypothetical protein